MPQRPTTILLADPDARQRQTLRQTLRVHGYRVLEATDAQDAGNVHQQHRGEIDLLVTAISLPGGNGLELAEAMRRSEPNLKVLLISAPVGAALFKFYNLEMTGVQFLQKPLRAADLLDRVTRALGSDDERSEASKA